eukprot:CAMPEP_0181326662 /NCGR_PEP_ID=MMETSP1101-20121128/21641_1 /TAXON_ID=46948 /ORGANISM="Rhodomonas abbreviata, Strain Caron Lab Isolate" /LENGTH=339 /DNA_ID=CAMNT_0023435177 /DNA_START=9 /DNA_END=1028 /DNA_ORIENTATION=+
MDATPTMEITPAMISDRESSFNMSLPQDCFQERSTSVDDDFDAPFPVVWEGSYSREQSFGYIFQPPQEFSISFDMQNQETLKSPWPSETDQSSVCDQPVFERDLDKPAVLDAFPNLQNDQSRKRKPQCEDEYEDEDEDGESSAAQETDSEHAYQPNKKQKKCTQNKQCIQPLQGQSLRGKHVKERPHMQRDARNGQANWSLKVKELRQQWIEKRMWEHNQEFREQLRMCADTHVKSQHECLLRQLQMALVSGWIKEAPFSSSDKDSFLGWTGFQVVAEHGAEFRRSIEDMFEKPPQVKTLNNSLRRAGLVAKDGWPEAWCGASCFVYDGSKRASYTSKK